MTMTSGEKLGEIREGHLADLLLVDGDPLADLSILVNSDRPTLIMKDGQIHKHTNGHRAASRSSLIDSNRNSRRTLCQRN